MVFVLVCFAKLSFWENPCLPSHWLQHISFVINKLGVNFSSLDKANNFTTISPNTNNFTTHKPKELDPDTFIYLFIFLASQRNCSTSRWREGISSYLKKSDEHCVLWETSSFPSILNCYDLSIATFS